MKAAEREREVVKRIRDAYGDVTYDWQTDANGAPGQMPRHPHQRGWVRYWDTISLETVRMVQSQDPRFDDAALESVKGLRKTSKVSLYIRGDQRYRAQEPDGD